MTSRQSSVEEFDSMSISYKNTSIRSSLSSLFSNYDLHFSFIKLMSLLMLLSIMCVTITITSNIGSCENKSSVRDCIKLSTTDVEPNSFTRGLCCISLL